MSDDIIKLSGEYLQARKEAQTSDLDVEALREEREEWKSKMEKLDENDPLYDVAKQNFEERDKKLKQGQQSVEEYTQLEAKLLENTASEFVPNGKWTNEEVLRALNLAILGSDRDYIQVGTTHIEDGTEVEDDEKLFDISLSIRDVAKEELQQSTKLSDFWCEFNELDRFRLFKEVVHADDPLSGSDIAKRRNEEENRQSISQTLINTTNGEVDPYYKQGRGEYTLSFVGEYLVQEFWNESSEEVDKSEDDDDDASLDDF